MQRTLIEEKKPEKGKLRELRESRKKTEFTKQDSLADIRRKSGVEIFQPAESKTQDTPPALQKILEINRNIYNAFIVYLNNEQSFPEENFPTENKKTEVEVLVQIIGCYDPMSSEVVTDGLSSMLKAESITSGKYSSLILNLQIIFGIKKSFPSIKMATIALQAMYLLASAYNLFLQHKFSCEEMDLKTNVYLRKELAKNLRAFCYNLIQKIANSPEKSKLKILYFKMLATAIKDLLLQTHEFLEVAPDNYPKISSVNQCINTISNINLMLLLGEQANLHTGKYSADSFFYERKQALEYALSVFTAQLEKRLDQYVFSDNKIVHLLYSINDEIGGLLIRGNKDIFHPKMMKIVSGFLKKNLDIFLKNCKKITGYHPWMTTDYMLEIIRQLYFLRKYLGEEDTLSRYHSCFKIARQQLLAMDKDVVDLLNEKLLCASDNDKHTLLKDIRCYCEEEDGTEKICQTFYEDRDIVNLTTHALGVLHVVLIKNLDTLVFLAKGKRIRFQSEEIAKMLTAIRNNVDYLFTFLDALTKIFKNEAMVFLKIIEKNVKNSQYLPVIQDILQGTLACTSEVKAIHAEEDESPSERCLSDFRKTK